ncbi:PREDICTED: uncharacterized protein LOC108375500 isoform X1 [Rhagoletis zephyria]|uniref:uncharacterized protein LOC108375500 isoform X1 n=1 Tax=Rhagoletis zephyria TaxID=28612 RepID=UPI0008116B5E|nr:PREDICTED: uncharacterized protein LOC108375500 isoform X1 [Rhagoletis zephyria]
MPSSDKRSEKSKSSAVAANGAAPPRIEIPKWLTAELFEQLLRESVANYQKITQFEAKPALAAGENYATIMLRVNIEAELKDDTTKSLSYMMKIPQENEIFKEMMRNHNIFEIEYRMYHEVVPEFEQLYRDVGIERNFSAKCYDIDTPSEFGVILLEDLQPFGYKNANRLEGLDLEHTKAVLERLAQWHAASAMRVETRGLYPELFIKGMFTESQRKVFDSFSATIKAPFLESVKAIEGGEAYVGSAAKAFDIMLEELFIKSTYDPSEFNVLNHGDCWSNNVMFKYDSEGKLENTLLIDYQMINYGSPAKDLHYFLTSSTSYDVKVKQFDYFIKFYHDNLVKNLKLLKYPKKLPTLKEIHIAMIKNGMWGLAAALGVMAAALLESNSDANMDGFFGDSDAAVRFRNAMFTNPRYRKHLEILLPFMSNRGAFE